MANGGGGGLHESCHGVMGLLESSALTRGVFPDEVGVGGRQIECPQDFDVDLGPWLPIAPGGRHDAVARVHVHYLNRRGFLVKRLFRHLRQRYLQHVGEGEDGETGFR